jgi:hypothetical protein
MYHFFIPLKTAILPNLTDQGKITHNSKNLVQLLDEYSIVIQEFFQKRVEIWLETVGHAVFDIKHYWLRYEFAPSRGQIHAHLLAICGDYSFNVAMHRLKGNKEAQAKVQSWSKRPTATQLKSNRILMNSILTKKTVHVQNDSLM